MGGPSAVRAQVGRGRRVGRRTRAGLAPADRRRIAVDADDDVVTEDFDGLAVLDELALAVRGLVAACRRDTWLTLRASDWSVQQIADHWAVTDKAVYKVLSRAKEQ